VTLFCGIDWAESHHDVAIIDGGGQLVAKRRIPDDPSGFAELTEMLTAAGDCAEDPVPLAVETLRGPLVASRRATGRPVYAINPLAVARYRERDSVARAKSDHGDAIAPIAAAATKLSASRMAAALRRAGRTRGIDQTAAEIKAELRKTQLRQSVLVETAMAKQTLALLAALDTACNNVEDLGQAAAELFQQHPDYAIITSFPGLADSTGARVLAEIGDDRARFVEARALKAYAGSAPITRASGRSISVTHRHIKNNRLANAGRMWAFSAASNCEHARQQCRRRRDHGDRHAAATRHLFNKLPGQLHHCLQHGQSFDEAKAFPAPLRDAV